MAEHAVERTLRAHHLGRVKYAEAIRLQHDCRDRLLTARALALDPGPALSEALEGSHETLFLLEHPPVYTLGRNASSEDVVALRPWMDDRQIEVFETDRGGQVTYHGPGQLMAYPVLDLDPDRRDLRRYVRDLQEVIVRTLSDYEIEGHLGEGPEEIGVWVGIEKIASIGVHVKRWITTHGFALNVSTELEMFQGIIACGLRDVSMTSVERLSGAKVPLEQVSRRCAEHFASVFERRLQWQNGPAAQTPSFGNGEYHSLR